MALDLAQRKSIGLMHQSSFRNVRHHTPRLYPVPSEEVEHPAPIINTNVNPVSEIFTYTGDHTKFVLVMVGLPARGKSFIARKIRSYLSWLGIDVQWFNIGQYRRYCAKDTVGVQSSSFFDPTNQLAKKRRELYALIALAELEKYLVFNKGQVAILDGTNTTSYRRKMIRNFFIRKNRPSPNINIKIVFIESICNDERIIEKNILNVKLRSPDYINVLPEKAVKDFKERIKHYTNMYVPLTEDDGSFIKLYDAGKKVEGHQVNGYLPSRILYFLMHLTLTKVPHFFTRHGESLYNTLTRIGGDSPLTQSGVNYSKTMADFMSLQPEFTNGGMRVWCSTLKRCTQTAQPFENMDSGVTASTDNIAIYCWRALCEIEAGICDSMTYKDIEKEFPDEYIARSKNKLTYRYPQGESYKDVIKRLEPVIFELERATKPVLVIAHQAVLRCLYGYFMDKPLEEVPYLKIDLHTVYKLSPTDYSTEVDKFTFGCGQSKINSDSSPDLGKLLRLGKPSSVSVTLSCANLPTNMRPKLENLGGTNSSGNKKMQIISIRRRDIIDENKEENVEKNEHKNEHKNNEYIHEEQQGHTKRKKHKSRDFMMKMSDIVLNNQNNNTHELQCENAFSILSKNQTV